MKRFKKFIAILMCICLTATTLTMVSYAEMPPMPEAYETGFIDSEGAKIEYALYGQQDGEAMLLLPGNGSDLHHFDDRVLPYFAEHFNVITVSPRGTGNSTRGDCELTFDVMSDDLVNLLDYLNIEKTNIFGFSDGGNLALVFTVAHQDRVITLVPMSANINTSGTNPIIQTGFIIGYAFDWIRASITKDPDDETKRDIQGLMVFQPTLTFDDLKTINVPTLNIYGQFDIIRRSHSKKITESIPGAKELMIQGTGHSSSFTKTDSVIIPALYEFYSITE